MLTKKKNFGKKEIIKSLSENKKELETEFKVRSLALFGSCARGDYGPESDVDLLVDVDPSIGLEFVSLAEKLEKLLGRHVDLVSSRALKPKRLDYIKKELIYV